MNKLNNLLLEDFLKDSSDTRLFLFINGINKDFPVTKASKTAVRLLIEDYKADKSKLRLKTIEKYLSNGESSAKKPKVNKLIALVGPKVEKDPKVLRMMALRDSIQQMRQTPHQLTELIAAEKELNKLETEAGLRSSKDPKDWTPEERQQSVQASEISLLKGAFGDWHDPKSFAHEILYGNKPKFILQRDTIGTPEFLMELLEKYSGSRARKLVATTLVGGGQKPVIEFCDPMQATPSYNNDSRQIAVKG